MSPFKPGATPSPGDKTTSAWVEAVLVVGCGRKPKPGAVNLDRVALPGVDVVFDLDRLRAWDAPPAVPTIWGETYLPFDSNTFDRVEAEDVIEHVADPITVVQELGRVLKPGGKLWIRGPDWRYEETWSDLTHKRGFAPRTFDGFDPSTRDGREYGYYHGPIKFKIVQRAKEVNHGLEWLMEKM